MFIGIDLGGSHIAAGLIDGEGKLHKRASCVNHIEKSYVEYVKSMADLCHELLNESGLSKSEIKSIGIGHPGTVNNNKGTVTCISNIKIIDVSIRDEIHKYIDLPVFIENDAKCAAFGEHIFGAAKGANISATVTIGTGIGVGLIIDNKIFGGFNHAAPEFGHHVIVAEGERCTCGRRGCWEAYSSATALVREAKTVLDMESNYIDSKMMQLVDGDFSKVDPKVIFQAAQEGDLLASEVVHNYVKYLSEGLANLINAFMPEVISIAGGISLQGDYLLDMLKKRIYNKIYTKSEPKTIIKIAELGADAGIIGAAMLGRG